MRPVLEELLSVLHLLPLSYLFKTMPHELCKILGQITNQCVNTKMVAKLLPSFALKPQRTVTTPKFVCPTTCVNNATQTVTAVLHIFLSLEKFSEG